MPFIFLQLLESDYLLLCFVEVFFIVHILRSLFLHINVICFTDELMYDMTNVSSLVCRVREKGKVLEIAPGR